MKQAKRARPRARKTKVSRKRKRSELQPGNMADVDGTTFVVFNIFAHPASGNLVVAYYEADAIEHLEDISFETLRDLDATHEQDLYLRAGEYVSVADYQDVMTWVLESDPVDSRHHIPGLSPTLCCEGALADVDVQDAAVKKNRKKQKAMKNTRRWVADVPGVSLVGCFFVDPIEEGETPLGLCYVVPRPKVNVNSTRRSFYTPYRYADSRLKKPEQSTTEEVAKWVADSAGVVGRLQSCFVTSLNFWPTLSAIFRGWWRVTVLTNVAGPVPAITAPPEGRRRDFGQ